MFIYLITNAVNGKIYVGQHKGGNLKKYLQGKFSDAFGRRQTGRSHLYAAMRKHGRGAFSIEPIAEIHGDMPKTVLDSLETFCIAFLDSRNHDKGYNICRGGEGFTGPFTARHRAKLSRGIKASWTPERRATQSAQRTGIPRPPQVGEAVRRMRTGARATAETREKIRAARRLQNPRLGTSTSEEAKKRMSDAHKGKPSSFRGKHHTNESNEKNRLAHLTDLQGQQFGNVLVVSLAGTSLQGHAEWAVRCAVCGAEGTAKRSGRVKSGESPFMRTHQHRKQTIQSNIEASL